MAKITISEILKGLVPGEMQTVGYMQVIPLLAEEDWAIDERFVPYGGLKTSTRAYGSLIVENPTNDITIFPVGAAILVKHAAQNHAVGKLKLMNPKERTQIDTAACIQERQGGTIPSGSHPVSILPWSLREAAFYNRDIQRHDKLWPAIRVHNKSLGLRNLGHLEDFLDGFKSELDEFIGQFEVVKNQIGAIVIINGEVIGIERAPNFKYWKEIFKPLIRECYGSESLRQVKQGDTLKPPLGRMPLKGTNISSIADIQKQLDKADQFERDAVKRTINTFFKKPFKLTREETEYNGPMVVETLTGGQFTGQIVRDHEKVVYASLMLDMNSKQNMAPGFKM